MRFLVRMRTSASVLLFASLVFFLLAQRTSAQFPRYVPGEILVGFDRADVNGNIPGLGAPSRILGDIGQVSGIQREIGVARVHLKPSVSLRQAILALRRRPGIRFAEPNFLRYTTATPDDPYYATNQWAPQRISMELAWGEWQPIVQKVVAIIDTGVDYGHPDLTDVLFRDGTGTVIGYNAQTGTADARDDHGHGTHCAGISAAHIDNGIGIAGIAGWNPAVAGSDTFAKIMPVKVLSSQGIGTDGDVANGIIWASDHGASVVSMSLGGPDYSTTLRDAVAYAINHDVVVCAAAGNSASSTPLYPAAYQDVISVAATDSDPGDTLASFSNWGPWVKVAAPGKGIFSTLPTADQAAHFGTNYGSLSGTSMATPHVAGEALMLRIAYPALTNLQIAGFVIDNVDPYTPISGHTLPAGAGRINVHKALQAAGSAAGGLLAMWMTPNPVTGGASAVGTITLGIVAPAGGKVVTLTSNASSVVVPASVTVPAGKASVNFTATTDPVASTVNAKITATTTENNLTMTLVVSPPVVSTVTLSPSTVVGGNSSTATVTLTGPAPAAGKSVALTSSNAAATVPSSIIVAAGDTTATFAVNTTPVSANTTASITAKTGSTTKKASLTIKVPAPLSVTFDPKTVMAGKSCTGTVTLSGPAPSTGVTVSLSSNKPEVTVPASISISAGATTGSFTAKTSNVTANLTATVSATAYSVTKSGSLAVVPVLKSVTVSPTSVIGGKSATGTVTLSDTAPQGGIAVTLSTTNGAVILPASVTVPEGSASATFSVKSSPVSTNTSGIISGAALGVTKPSGTFTVKPPALSSFTFNPTSIVIGTNSTGKLTINGPAPAGFKVTLASANPNVVPVPASITFATGATSATFTVTGGTVAASTSVTVTAKDPALVTKTAALTVHP